MESRADYVAWCKSRALAYWADGDLKNAVTSMLSDMNKREDTRVSPVLFNLALLHLLNGDAAEVERWITGFC